jgi:hypothetical protein
MYLPQDVEHGSHVTAVNALGPTNGLSAPRPCLKVRQYGYYMTGIPAHITCSSWVGIHLSATTTFGMKFREQF